MQNKTFKKETFTEGLYRKIFTKFQDIIDEKTEETSNNIYESVGQCPKCKKDVLHLDNHYSCLGILSNKCNFRVPDTFKGDKISYDYILTAMKQKAMHDEGFFEHLDLGISTNKSSCDKPKKNTTNSDSSNAVNTKKTAKNTSTKKEVSKNTSTKKEVSKKELVNNCPRCSGSIEIKKNSYNCTKCDYKLDKFFYKTKIEPNEVNLLLSKGETNELEFTDKDGEKFKSKLSLNNNKCNYVFSSNKNDIESNEDTISNDDVVLGAYDEYYEENIDYAYEENIDYAYEEAYYNGYQEQPYKRAAIAICPKCKKDVIAGKNAFGCIGNKDKTCTFKVPFNYNSLSISVKDIQDLVNNKTITIIDLNNTEVYLKLDKNLELEQVLF